MFLVPEPFLFQAGADARIQQHRIEGFGQVVLGADFDATDDAVDFIYRGEHDDRGVAVRCVCLEQFERLQPVQLGHKNVQQHEVHFDALDDLQRFASVHRLDDRMALALQSAAQHVAVYLIVVHHQD